MARALSELVVEGVETSTPLLRRIMMHPAFLEGALTIRFLEDYPELLTPEIPEETAFTAAVAAALLEHEARRQPNGARMSPRSNGGFSAWRAAGLPIRRDGRGGS